MRSRALSELCTEITDCHHSTPKWTERGILVLRSFNGRSGCLDLSRQHFTDEGTFAERTRRAVPMAGDIVFAREAPMGEVAAIPAGLRT